MKITTTLYLCVIFLSNLACQPKDNHSYHQLVGGPCQGCEAIYEYGSKILKAIDTLPGYHTAQSKIHVKGTVYKSDGTTPANDVIIYIYHTDQDGLYVSKDDASGWGRHHGFLRGWVKTDIHGNYSFHTFRPAAYPNNQTPEHIHLTIKEPTKNEYYIDSIIFDDDPLLTKTERKKLENRGGSGITFPHLEKDISIVKRDIILGMNIPNY